MYQRGGIIQIYLEITKKPPRQLPSKFFFSDPFQKSLYIFSSFNYKRKKNQNVTDKTFFTLVTYRVSHVVNAQKVAIIDYLYLQLKGFLLKFNSKTTESYTETQMVKLIPHKITKGIVYNTKWSIYDTKPKSLSELNVQNCFWILLLSNVNLMTRFCLKLKECFILAQRIQVQINSEAVLGFETKNNSSRNTSIKLFTYDDIDTNKSGSENWLVWNLLKSSIWCSFFRTFPHANMKAVWSKMEYMFCTSILINHLRSNKSNERLKTRYDNQETNSAMVVLKTTINIESWHQTLIVISRI